MSSSAQQPLSKLRSDRSAAEESAVEAAYKAYLRAWKDKNYVALDRLLSDDYKAVNFRGLVSTKAGLVRGLEKYAELIRLLTETKGAIKVDCDVAAIEGAQKGRRSGLGFLDFVCRVATDRRFAVSMLFVIKPNLPGINEPAIGITSL